MKKKTFGLLMVFAAMFISATLAQAGQITATHTIISQQIDATGGTIATLNITVNDTGASELTNVSIDVVSSMMPVNDVVNTLSLGNLLAGGQVSSQWVISTPMQIVFPGSPIMIHGMGYDPAGNAIEFTVLSKEVML